MRESSGRAMGVGAEGEQRVLPHFPLINHKIIGFLINTGLDHMENHKATKTAFNVGPPSARQRRFAGS